MLRQLLLGISALITCCAVVRADHFILESGKEFDGIVIQESDSSYTIALEHGTATLPKSVVKSIKAAPMPPPAPAVPITPAAPALVKPVPAIGTAPAVAPGPAPALVAVEPTVQQRLPGWSVLVSSLAKRPWATSLAQIPATVVDKGQMRFVPYSSFRCGNDYEMNIYGDPDSPAGIEIGVYRTLLKSEDAKTRCLDFIASALPNRADAGIVEVLDRVKDLATHDGITIEITPATADDAYGGWWISVYDEKALDAARATPEEIQQITMAKTDATGTTPDDSLYGWTAGDIDHSRPSTGTGGSVYVHGYYRANGTYVSPHSRAAPGTGTGRGHR